MHVIMLEKNGGVSRARNIGIRVASAAYVTMLDSDDFYYSKDKISNEMEALRTNSPDGLAYSYRQVIDENGNLLYNEVRYWDRYCSGDVYKQLLSEICALMNLYKRIYNIIGLLILGLGLLLPIMVA